MGCSSVRFAARLLQVSTMIRVTRNPTFEWDDNSERYVLVSHDGVYLYDGPVALCKKGRDVVEKNMKSDQATATQNRANSQDAYNKTQGLLGENIGSSAPGSLTPAASAQLAADTDNINRTYNGIRRQQAVTLGQRGFSNAPSGFSLAAENGANQGQEQSETGAFRNAQLNTQNQRNFATGEEASLTGQQGSLGNQASGESTSAAVARNHMGSTFGETMGGIAQIAPIAATPFTGGASLGLMGANNP